MTSVASFRTFAYSSSVPIAAFADMQQEYLAKARVLAISVMDLALGDCRKVLDQRRRVGLLATFMRLLSQSAFFSRATPSVPWIDDFNRDRNERVFERSSPSCYSCEGLTVLISQRCGGIVPARSAGESACLSDLVETFDCNHKVISLCDESAGHALDDAAADRVHSAVSKISRLYGEVYETADWIASTLSRKLGNGKNAGG